MPISAFDLDRTLIKGNSSFRFGMFLYKNKILPFPKMALLLGYYGLHRLKLLTVSSMHHAVFKQLFYQRSSIQVQTLVQQFLKEEFPGFLYMPAVAKLREAQQAGHYVIILSSSPDFLVGPIAELLHVQKWRATHYAIDKDHQFCQILYILVGKSKAELLLAQMRELGIPKEKVYAYSDCSLDLPFLKVAGNPRAVQPRFLLRLIAFWNNWAVIKK